MWTLCIAQCSQVVQRDGWAMHFGSVEITVSLADLRTEALAHEGVEDIGKPTGVPG